MSMIATRICKLAAAVLGEVASHFHTSSEFVQVLRREFRLRVHIKLTIQH